MAKVKKEVGEAPQAAPDSAEPKPSTPKPWLNKRNLHIALAILGGLVFLQVALWAGLSYKSVTGEDLTIFLEPETEYLQLRQGESETINFTLGVNNLAFCEAVCNWSASDHEAVLASGELIVSSKQNEQLGYEITAPDTGTGKTAYQVQVSCYNPPKQYCKSSGKLRYATVVTIVNVTYSEEKEEDVAALAEVLPLWEASTLETLSTLQGIAGVNDTRARAIAQAALGEAAELQQRAEQVRVALYAERFGDAKQLIEKPQPNMSIQAYGGIVELEQQAAAHYNASLQREGLASILLKIVNEKDHERLVRAAQTANALHGSFYRQPPSQSMNAFRQFTAVVDELNNSYTVAVQRSAENATLLLEQELRMGCTLKNLACHGVPATSASDLPTAVSALQSRCSELKALPLAFTDMQSEYAEQLDDSLNVSEVEELYGVPEARSGEGFAALAQQLRGAARNGTLLTTNVTLRLAVPLEVGAEAASFISSFCALRNESLDLPDSTLSPALSASVKAEGRLPKASLPQPTCCSLGECIACVPQARYPVVFVHGHSFTASTAPEYSLNAFTPYAQALQQAGYLYAGHVFPRDDFSDTPYAELQQLPSGVTFTATYYYNSYPEEGKTRFVVRKSENIETYAIRLKEDIELVKHQTGQEKVVVVAHSMGGLVSRRYLQLFGEQDTAALIMIGTPNHGISNATQDLCPIFGGDKECDDMYAGSVFISKLNAGRQPRIPVYTFAGTGCSGRAFDGVVEVSSVQLPYANNSVVDGSCPSRSDLLHSALLDPQLYPGLYSTVRALLDQHTTPAR